MKDRYDNAKKDSVKESGEIVSIKKHKAIVNMQARKSFIAGLALALAVSIPVTVAATIGTQKTIDEAKENVIVGETIKPYIKMVNENTYGTENSNGKEYYYDTDAIASYLYKNETPETIDTSLFATYNNVKFGKMSDVISELSQLDSTNELLGKDYSTFTDYLNELGFVDKTTGEVNYNAYEEAMENIITAKKAYEESVAKVGK